MAPAHPHYFPVLSGIPGLDRLGILIFAILTLPLFSANSQEVENAPLPGALAAIAPGAVVGATECAECHSREEKVWKMSAHFRSNDTHRDPLSRDKAFAIASRMGIYARDIPTHARCVGCHATVQENRQGVLRAISGASCESCHGSGLNYIDVHGEEKEIPSRNERRKLSIAGGMSYPHETHKIAAQCFRCHVVQEEDLVNVGGHPARTSGFELLTWSQGEVRHNFYDESMHRNTNVNHDASSQRRRQMFVIGLLTDLEVSLRGLSKGQQRGNEFPYRQSMGKRAYAIIHTELPALVEACGGLEHSPPQITEILRIGKSTDLKGTSEAVLQSASAIKAQIADFSVNGPRALGGGIDNLIPEGERGEAYQP